MRRSAPSSNDETGNLIQRAEDFGRREPARIVVSAFGAGLLLRCLPLGAIAFLVHAAFTLIHPALLVLGAVKAFEFCRTNTHTRL